MKILHIIDSMWLWWAQTVIKWIFESQKDNNNIYFYSLRKREINTKIEHKNIFWYNSFSKFSLIPILKLRKFIKENNIKILHCHLAKSQIFWAIIKTLFFPKIKLIFHEHWEIFQKWKIYPFLMNLFRKKVDLYLAVSKATKNKIIEKTSFSEKKVKVLYNFVDLYKFKKLENFDIKKERKKYWLNQNDFVIWFASRLYEWKWWKEFVWAAKILIEKWYDFKFIIWWEWEDKEKINNFIIKNNLEKNIKLIWYIENMVYIYNMIDLFIFPSHREALPMTILEVNAIWIPLIASNIDWVNEILKNDYNALLFEKWNIWNLVKKIIYIYKGKNSLIINWLIEVKKYSLKKYIRNLFKLYK